MLELLNDSSIMGEKRSIDKPLGCDSEDEWCLGTPVIRIPMSDGLLEDEMI